MRTLILTLTAIASASAENLCRVENAAIQAAIDQCASQGGGVAYVPPGTYSSGPLWLKDNVELRLEAGATIALSQNPDDWPKGSRALINSKGAKRIAITGRGVIDGKAQYEYIPMHRLDVEIQREMDIATKAGIKLERYYRTGVQKYLVVLQDSQDARIEGVQLLHSPLWTVRLQDCDRVWIRGVYLYSDLEKGVNSDGIDIVSTSNVLISDSMIITADDAIVLKTTLFDGRVDANARPVRPIDNVVVQNCILSSSSTPMMIGTETHADIRNVLFSNIVVRDSNKVFGINVQDGATVSNVRFHNVTYELNRRHWNWWGSAEVFKFVLKKRTPESRLGRIEDITIDGANGTARGTSVISGYTERPLENITIRNLRLKMLPEMRPDKRATHAIEIERVRNLTLKDIEVTWDRANPEPAWGSALVLRNIDGLTVDAIRAEPGNPKDPAIQKEP